MTTDNTKPTPYLFKNLTIFDGFEVEGCKVFNTGLYVYVEQVEDNETEFFTLYGHYDPTDFNNGVPYAKVGLECILDFQTRHEAERASRYFSAYRQLMLDVRRACDRYNELLEDDNISTATDVIEGIMEEMEALEASLAGREGYGQPALQPGETSKEGGA